MKPNTWAMLCHLCGLVGYLGNGIGNVIGPLLVWLIKKDEIPEVERHGKEALNFNISILLYGAILVVVTMASLGFAALLTVPAGIALFVFHLVCTIQAAIKANNGEDYEYPLTIRLVK